MVELFGLLFFALAVLLFFGLVTSLIILIVMAARKKPVKNAGIMTGALGGSFVFVVILMFVTLANMEDATPQTASYPTSSSDAQSDEEQEVEGEEIDLATEEVEEEPDEVDELIAEVDEQIEQEEQERQEALENRPDTSDRDNYRSDVDVRDVERNPNEYMHELVVFEGKIIQVIEEDNMSAYRVAVNDDHDRIVLVSTLSSSLEERLLEDDYVTVYGEFTELLTYETVMGGSRTVPSFVAMGENIILQ